MGPEKGRLEKTAEEGHPLLGRGVLSDCLGSFRNSVLRQFTRQKETHSCLNFPRGDGGTLVVVRQTGSFSSNPLKNVVHKAVHDGHGFPRNASVRVNLLQDLVDVDPVALLPAFLLLLVPLGDILLGLSGLFRCLSRRFRCHFAYNRGNTSVVKDHHLSRKKVTHVMGHQREHCLP